MSRPRVAYLSPMPPQPTGIADYSAELLPPLAEHVDLQVFSPSVAEERAGASGRRLKEFEPGDFDLALYQIGNNEEFHGAIYRLALQHPGLVVLHEYVLHHLIRGLTLGRGRIDDFSEELRYAYGETGWRAIEQFLDTGVPVDPWQFPLFERLLDAARGVIVHSRAVRDRLLASRPLARVRVVPHHLAIEALDERVDARTFYRGLGIDDRVPVIGVFGFVTPQKRIDVVIEAFREVLQRHPAAHLVIVGAVSGFYDIGELRGDAPAQVIWTGRVGKTDLLQAMAGCDLAINLRFPTGGETSGTAIRLLGLGKPLIVNDVGWFGDIPAGCAARVPVGRGEHEALVATVDALLADRDLAATMGANAARRVRSENSLAVSAAGYAEAIVEAIRAPAPCSQAVPPLAPGKLQFGPSTLVGVARAGADLGWTEDEPALVELAQVGVQLDLDRELPGIDET